MGNNVSYGGPTDQGPVTFEEMQIRTKEAGREFIIVHQVVILHVKVLVRAAGTSSIGIVQN